MMDDFENQIIHVIKKIRDLRQRPDADRTFRTITEDAATNICLADIQQKIDQIISGSQLQNKPCQGMDSQYVSDSSLQTRLQTPSTKVRYYTSHKSKIFLNDLKSSDNTKNMSYDVDVQPVPIKVYFMNEIYELKREISQLKIQEPGSVTVQNQLQQIYGNRRFVSCKNRIIL